MRELAAFKLLRRAFAFIMIRKNLSTLYLAMTLAKYFFITVSVLLIVGCGNGGNIGDTSLFEESLNAVKGGSWPGTCEVGSFASSGSKLTETTLRGKCTIELIENEGEYEIQAWWRQDGQMTYEKGKLSEFRVEKEDWYLSKTIKAKYTPTLEGRGGEGRFTMHLIDRQGELADQFYIYLKSTNDTDRFWAYVDTYPELLAILKDKLFNDEHGPLGCTDKDACNFDSEAVIVNNEVCDYAGTPCDDGDSATYFDVLSDCDICQGLPIASVNGPCQGKQFLHFTFERWGISGEFNSPLIEFDDKCVTLKPFLPPYNQPEKQLFKLFSRKSKSDLPMFVGAGPLDEFIFYEIDRTFKTLSWDMNYADLLVPGWKPAPHNILSWSRSPKSLQQHLKDQLGFALPEHPAYTHGSSWDRVDSTAKSYHLEFIGVAGCVLPDACNYNPQALDNDGSCLFAGDPCDDQDSLTIGDYIDSNCNCVSMKNTLVKADASGPCSGLTEYNFNGEQYSLVEIGSECLFNQSLRQKAFTNGGGLQQINSAVQQNSNEPGFFIDSLGIYRYNEKAIIVGQQESCLCPEGWNVPSQMIYLKSGGKNPELALRGTSLEELSILWPDLGFAPYGGIPYKGFFEGVKTHVRYYEAEKFLREQPLQKFEKKRGYPLTPIRTTQLVRRVGVNDIGYGDVGSAKEMDHRGFVQVICVRD